MANTNLILFVVLGFFLCAVIAEVLLSRIKSPVPGLILPILSLFMPVLLLVRSFINYQVFPSIYGVLVTVFFCSCPTLVLLLIYYLVRRRYTQKKQMDKMNIQDL